MRSNCNSCIGGIVLRFIHTADWHLGRIFHGQHLTEDQSYLLQDFLRMVTETKAEAVILAGDIYDRAVPPTEAVELFDEVLAKLLLEKKVKVFFIAGNHDSASRIGFGSRLFAGQGLFVQGLLTKTMAPVVLEDSYGPVYFSLLPYMEPSTVRSVFRIEEMMDFDAATGTVVEQAAAKIPAGRRSVAVAHAFIAGGQSSESERPLSVGGSSNVGAGWFRPFSYTALGHLHNAQPAGAENIRYSGSLMKYSFDEAGQKKSLAVVEMDGTGQVTAEFLPLVPKHDVCRVKGSMAEILQNREKYPCSEDYMLVELTDSGAVLDAHGKLEKVYPNLMQIERPGLLQSGELREHGTSYIGRPDDVLFADFFQDMTGEALDEAQQQALKVSMEELWRAEREGK